MSTAMMSAPSWASRTASARPCPRAAPVMKATFPVKRSTVDIGGVPFVWLGWTSDRVVLCGSGHCEPHDAVRFGQLPCRGACQHARALVVPGDQPQPDGRVVPV